MTTFDYTMMLVHSYYFTCSFYSLISNLRGSSNLRPFSSIAKQPALRMNSYICACISPVSSEILATVLLTGGLNLMETGFERGVFLLIWTTFSYTHI